MGSDLGAGLWGRLAALFLAMSAVALAAVQPGLVVAKLVALALAMLLAVEVVRYVRRANRDLTRFLAALEYSDLSQTFSTADPGLGVARLATALNGVMGRLRDSRAALVTEARVFRALVEHVPIPLLAVHGDGRLELLNGAARRLFGSTALTTVESLREYGDRLWRDVLEEVPGRRRLTEMIVEGTRQAVTLAVAEVGTEQGKQRVVSLQNIQGELDASELVVWRELVRVLTHEIMNSLTPLTSLAKTAAEAVRRAEGSPELDDARVAIETLERRADRLMHFVDSYRRLTRLPPPRPRAFALGPLLDGLVRVLRAEWPPDRVAIEVRVEPASLELVADPEQVEQALLNLLVNAVQSAGRVWLSARADRLGRVVIEVGDDGPGVPPAIRDSIFLPFFTTKAGGTGVGLSLTRQIALAHAATVSVGDREGGGALFRLTFGRP